MYILFDETGIGRAQFAHGEIVGRKSHTGAAGVDDRCLFRHRRHPVLYIFLGLGKPYGDVIQFSLDIFIFLLAHRVFPHQFLESIPFFHGQFEFGFDTFEGLTGHFIFDFRKP